MKDSVAVGKYYEQELKTYYWINMGILLYEKYPDDIDLKDVDITLNIIILIFLMIKKIWC